MKTLVHPQTNRPLGFASDMTAAFEELETGETTPVGVVAEVPDVVIAAAAQKATKRNEWTTRADILRDLRFFTKQLVPVEDGAEVGVEAKGRGYALVLPKGAERIAADFKVGDAIVVNHLISPKYMMNARGTVEGVTKAKVTIRLDEGDARRIEHASGRKTTVCKMPPSTLDRA